MQHLPRQAIVKLTHLYNAALRLKYVPSQKKHLRAKRFESHVKHEVQTWLRGQDPIFYRQDFEKWISRLDKCNRSDYGKIVK